MTEAKKRTTKPPAESPEAQQTRPHADSCGGLNQAMDAANPAATWRQKFDETVRVAGCQPGATIHARLRAVRLDVGHISKGKQSGAGDKYFFRGIDDALNACGPIFVRYGVTVSLQADGLNLSREVVELPNRDGSTRERVDSHAQLRLTVRFSCERPTGVELDDRDQYQLEQVTFGEGVDYGSDKAINKATAAAYKYALFLGLCLPVSPDSLDDSDHDEKQDERAGSRPQGNQQQNRRPGNERGERAPMRTCPKCGAQAIIVGKAEYGGGFVCWKNKGGCGATFQTEQDLQPAGETKQPQTSAGGINTTPMEMRQVPNPPEQQAGTVDPAAGGGPPFQKFWAYCQALTPPVGQDAAGAIWAQHGSDKNRAGFAAWCASKGVEPEFQEAAWTQYKNPKAAIAAIEAALAADEGFQQ